MSLFIQSTDPLVNKVKSRCPRDLKKSLLFKFPAITEHIYHCHLNDDTHGQKEGHNPRPPTRGDVIIIIPLINNEGCMPLELLESHNAEP
mgnify:CR=1 FL=1